MKRSTLGIYQFNQAVGAVVLICAALFVGAWAISLAVWKYGRIEERWSTHLR